MVCFDFLEDGAVILNPIVENNRRFIFIWRAVPAGEHGWDVGLEILPRTPVLSGLDTLSGFLFYLTSADVSP